MAAGEGLNLRIEALRSVTTVNRSSQVIFILTALCCVVTGAWAEDSSALRADQLKAGYVFNFAKFVDWSTAAESTPLTVCFFGAPGIYDAFLTGIDKKRVGTRPLSARQILTAEEAESCDVLYMDARALQNERELLKTPRLLTVSDAKAFGRNGGMIELFTDSNRLRFNVNVGNAHRAGLRISSSLLELAATVDKESAQ